MRSSSASILRASTRASTRTRPPRWSTLISRRPIARACRALRRSSSTADRSTARSHSMRSSASSTKSCSARNASGTDRSERHPACERGGMPITDISQQLDRLAAFDSGPYPVISLYLNMQPDQHGRDNFEPFLRKEMADRVRTYGAEGPERKSLEQDVEKIRDYVKQVEPSANGLAIIACSGAEIFEAVPLSAPIPEHRLYISDYPHLSPRARLVDDYPKFVVLLADTHSARIFVVAGNAVEQTQHVESPKTRRHKMGGWSQARYQRHIENYHLHHAKEVIDTLARVVRDEGIASIILAGDEVIVPLLKDQLPKELAEKIVDSVKLDIRAPEHDVLAAAMATMRDKDAHSDRERVE